MHLMGRFNHALTESIYDGVQDSLRVRFYKKFFENSRSFENVETVVIFLNDGAALIIFGHPELSSPFNNRIYVVVVRPSGLPQSSKRTADVATEHRRSFIPLPEQFTHSCPPPQAGKRDRVTCRRGSPQLPLPATEPHGMSRISKRPSPLRYNYV